MPVRLILVLALLMLGIPATAAYSGSMVVIAADSSILAMVWFPLLILAVTPMPMILGIRLFQRHAWAYKWARVEAGLACGIGIVGIVAGMEIEIDEDLTLGMSILALSMGWYALWVLGRADVRAWLTWAPNGRSAEAQ